jgi:hypothetical protein
LNFYSNHMRLRDSEIVSMSASERFSISPYSFSIIATVLIGV